MTKRRRCRNTGLAERLLFHSRDAAGGCKIWTASTNGKGYGKLTADKKTITAHRAAYEAFIGSIPQGMYVLHSCHNPACISPNHLRLGTHQDNMWDRRKAGRTHARLSANEIFEIRRLRNSGLTLQKIATLFNVSTSYVWQVANLAYWKHLPPIKSPQNSA